MDSQSLYLIKKKTMEKIKKYIVPGMWIAFFTFLLVGAIVGTTSMTTGEMPVSKMKEEELSKWRNSNDTIFYKDSAVAIFEHYEYEYNPNHRTKNVLAELCFVQIDDDPENTNNLIRYVHTLHSHCKIQVEFKDQYDRIDIWKKRMNK